ncbi:glycosyl transferase family 1 [Acidiphilium sp. MT5]
MSENGSAPRIAMLLPPREGFAPDRAGAIALVVRRLALASHAAVLGAAQPGGAYPDIDYTPIAAPPPLGFGLAALRALRRLRPAVIEVHQQPRLARIIARVLPQSRVMLFLHNDPQAMRGLRSATARQRSLAFLHQTICVSAYLADRYREGLTHTERLTVLHNPLTLTDLPPRATQRTREILFAGRIVENKGVADFIAACAQALPALPGWSARIIGGDRFGPASPTTLYVQTMRDQAAQAGIICAGYQPHEQVLAAMAQAALVVVPSRWPEPFGLTALEAMASGAALIASNTGGLPELVGDGGLLVPPRDPAQLARAILQLAQDDTARAQRAEAGLAQARLFDTPIIAARLSALRQASP